jgi:hypothetical protein
MSSKFIILLFMHIVFHFWYRHVLIAITVITATVIVVDVVYWIGFTAGIVVVVAAAAAVSAIVVTVMKVTTITATAITVTVGIVTVAVVTVTAVIYVATVTVAWLIWTVRGVTVLVCLLSDE